MGAEMKRGRPMDSKKVPSRTTVRAVECECEWAEEVEAEVDADTEVDVVDACAAYAYVQLRLLAAPSRCALQNEIMAVVSKSSSLFMAYPLGPVLYCALLCSLCSLCSLSAGSPKRGSPGGSRELR
jgi:hypothetical protein